MNWSGVWGIAACVSRIRSHGSSRCVRTATPMWVLEVKSIARKPGPVQYRSNLQNMRGGQAGRSPQALVAVAKGYIDQLDLSHDGPR